MRSPVILWLDIAVVFGFVVLGRRTHEEAESLAGIMRTAAPFMLALAAGWVTMRAWQRPAALTTGAGVLLVTVAGGMVLRRLVFAEGTAATFVVVASAFLALGFLGWRLGAGYLAARRSHTTA